MERCPEFGASFILWLTVCTIYIYSSHYCWYFYSNTLLPHTRNIVRTSHQVDSLTLLCNSLWAPLKSCCSRMWKGTGIFRLPAWDSRAKKLIMFIQMPRYPRWKWRNTYSFVHELAEKPSLRSIVLFPHTVHCVMWIQCTTCTRYQTHPVLPPTIPISC